MGVGATLLATMLLGAWMRWALAGTLSLPLPFTHLRHAHSHLGYFGLLFPLAWLGWQAAGARAPGRWAMLGYGLSTALAFAGFLHDGYGAVAIVGCTLVAGFWLWSSGALLSRMRQLHDPLGAVPMGILASLACVPPIAATLRSDPALAHGFVSTFLSGLLLMVIIPSTLAASRVSPGPWPLLFTASALGSAFLGVAPSAATRAGLLLYAALLLAPMRSRRVDTHLRALWGLVAAGLGAMACDVLPNTRPVALGAIHFLVLGPVLASLSTLWLPRSPPRWAWWLGHAFLSTMSASLVLQAFVPTTWTWTVAALGGTGVLVWWSVVLLAQGTPWTSAPEAVQGLKEEP
jgi:hypothetical protein